MADYSVTFIKTFTIRYSESKEEAIKLANHLNNSGSGAMEIEVTQLL